MITPEQEKWNALLKAFRKKLKEIVEWNNEDILEEQYIINNTKDEDNVSPNQTVQLQNAIYDNEGSIHRQLYARFQHMKEFGTVVDIIQHHTEFPDHYRDTGLTETQIKTRTQHIHLTQDTMPMLIIAWLDWLEKIEDKD
jgi:mRNA-degrading endonuclease YafQ of YafQ-DinJ toxin-antitoxin module